MQKRILRITCFILGIILCNIGLPAQDISKTIQLPQNDMTGKAVIALIENTHPLQFIYGKEVSERLDKNLHFAGTRISIKQVVEALQEKAGIFHSLSGNGAVILKANAPVARTGPGYISGKILNERGEPLIGASIKVVQTGKGMQSNMAGIYRFELSPGAYTLEISFLGLQTRRITGIEVTSGKTTPLDVVLLAGSNALNAVVVTADYKKASVEGLYARQKNAASVTDGISSEQINRTPDINIGQVLRRVSGVTTVDNKYVVVRGLSERYNQAMIDGTVLPSTNMNKRNFSFDVIPQELVSSVVVNKTATPDISSEFSGGQVNVITMDIPTQNFTTITIGTGYNDRSTGKDFLMMGGRGKGDYLGFDDGRRKEPAGIKSWSFPNNVTAPPPGPPGNNEPLIPGSNVPYSSLDAIAQSKRLSSDGYRMAKYVAAPDQQYRLALGRSYALNDRLRFGFVGGITYRNQQRIMDFNNVRGNLSSDQNWMDSVENGGGKSYRFNTTLGAVLNMGLQGKTFKLTLKNMYSRIFDDNFNEAYRLNYYDLAGKKFREMFEDPQATEVWQHKLEAGNQLSKNGLKLEYSGAVTNIRQRVLDQRRVKYYRTGEGPIGGKEYYQEANIQENNRLDGDYDFRLWTQVKETAYNWDVSLSQPFNFLQNKSIAKIGYAGWHKHRTLGLTNMVPYTTVNRGDNVKFERPYWEIMDTANMGVGTGQAYYWAEGLNGPTFNGTMQTHAAYVMLDQRLLRRLRLVYGIRAEHYNLANRQKEYIKRRFGDIPEAFTHFTTTGESNWRILPSANLTYNLTTQTNIRLAYSKTAIRPDFRETAYFGFYDYDLDANISGRQLVSTLVDNLDLRYEWYPSAGEIISVSAFYKYLDQPIELILPEPGYYRFQNQRQAVNYGVEMEIRKSLGFIADRQWLHNLIVFGNGTIIKSKVDAQEQPMPGDNFETRRLPQQDRPLYGQSPWIVNAGLAWQGEIVGFTASYNRSGHRSYTISVGPSDIEYEKGRNMLDVQLSTRLFQKKAELKLNLGNLLDEYILYYRNVTAYESIPGGWKLVNGTQAYEKDKGDLVTYRIKTGRTYSLSLTYRL